MCVCNPPALAEAAELHEGKKWSAAVSAYKQCIASGLVVSNKIKSEVYFRLGHANDEMDDDKAAVKWYSKVIELNQRDSWHELSAHNRGVIYCGQEKYSAALADYTQAITICDEREDLADCYYERSRVYRALNQQNLEMSDLQAANVLCANPKHAERLKELTESGSVESKLTLVAISDTITKALSDESAKRKREELEVFESTKRFKSSENQSSGGRGGSGGGGGGGGAAADSKRDYKSESLPPLSKLSVAGVSDYLRSIGKPFNRISNRSLKIV